MEMNQIRYFLAVCEHRNFTYAASTSNVSQPSLTTAIKKLEEELGGTLFTRDRAGSQLTPLGKIVRPRLERILTESQEAKAEAVRHTKLDRVPILIGVGETIGLNKISVRMERFRKRLPQVDFELIFGSDDLLITQLREGNFDVIITSQSVNEDLYRIVPLYQEEYRVVISSNHALSELESISLANLANTSMLDRLNCEMRDTLHRSSADQGHDLYAAYRSNRAECLIALARQGLGAVILPETAIPIDDLLVSRSIEGTTISREVSAIRYRHQMSRPESNDLIVEIARA